MTGGKRRYRDSVPEHVEATLRKLCMALPEAYGGNEVDGS
jgi:hypothetical protein